MPTSPQARRRLLLGSLAAALVVVALALLVRLDLAGLSGFDRRLGSWPEYWTYTHSAADAFWSVLAKLFTTLPWGIYTAIIAGLLAWRRHGRAAIWAVGVMVGAAATTELLKLLLARARPVWQHPVERLSTQSFPSGHATYIAAGMGMATVLTVMLVRRRRTRRLLYLLWGFLFLLIGADRIFLGVHNVSDVLAGYAVGIFWVLLGLLVYSPFPRPQPAAPLPSPVPGTRRLAVVLNPVKVDDEAAFRATVEERAKRAGWDSPVWHTTTVEDPGRSMAEQAAVEGADLVLVCGGDGTVRTVCAELAGTGVPVGVIPMGTGNLLARNLGLPLQAPAAIDVALNGQDRAVDLVEVSGDGIAADEHFMVMAGMGFDALVMSLTNEQAKARIGWLAYLMSALRNLMFPAIRVEVSIDGAEFERHRARTVVVGNVGYLQAGIPLLPDASIDDGVLDVVLLSPRRFLSWVPVVVRVLSRNRRTDAALNRMTGRSISIRTSHDAPRQLDGDPIAPGKELHARCVHGKLLVRVPR